MTWSVMQVLHQGGGAGSVTSTLHLSLGLARAGYRVLFVCPPDSEVEALARAAGLEVHPVSLLSRERRANAARLDALLQNHPVDLINSQSARDRAAFTWLGLTRRLSVPLVVTRRQMPRTFPLENWLVSRVARWVVAVSPAVGEALVRRGTPRNKLVVIPNGLVAERVDRPVPDAAITEWRTRIQWDPSRRTIGVVARLKDQQVVISALEHVRAPVRLVLAGVEPSSGLAEVAARVPQRHAVVCLPFIPDIRPLYDLLELVLLPSRSEGLSQALLEAMALAKPVVASDSTGNRDLITDRVDGRLVPPMVPSAWADAIEDLLGNEGLARKLGQAASKTARVTYSLERTIQRTSGLYRSLLEGPGAR
jgi:glycosyltransferase involved in cell wall biosynthesis